MGSSVQRLEVLVIGLIVLIAGTVVAALMLVRPASPSAYKQTTPQPIGTNAAVRATSAPSVQPTVVPATIAPVATSAPQPSAETVTSGEPALESTLPRLGIPPFLSTIWPWLLLLSLIDGALLGLRIRRRRMSYTNQNVRQLLATADATTRADTIKVMQGLAVQGLLTGELAAAAGIDLTQPHKRRTLRLPRMNWSLPRFTPSRVTLPILRLPVVGLPKPRFPRRPQRPLIIDLAPTSSAPPPAMQPVAAALTMPAAPADDLRVAPIEALPGAALSEMALRDALIAQAVVAPELEHEACAILDESAALWTAEDRALAVATVIGEIRSEVGALRETPVQSSIIALDTASAPGSGQVLVTIDQHPDDEATLIDLPDQIVARRLSWRVTWQQDVLEVLVTDEDQPPVGGPLIAPILAHGRGGKTIRFYPLVAWRHLGLYGGNTLHTLHAALGSMLYTQPPSSMALAIMDKGEITALYRNVAHLVPLPDKPHETIERLAQAIRRGAQGVVRPLVLVIVEPDDTMLNQLISIVARLQARPATPVHLIIAQERLSSAGRELYAMLPALILGGGRGSPALLPGQGGWPKRGEARLAGRGMRAEGRAITLDEAALAGLVAELGERAGNLPPVLWDIPAPLCMPPLADVDRSDEPLGAGEGPSDDETLAAHVDPGAVIAPQALMEPTIDDTEMVMEAPIVEALSSDGHTSADECIDDTAQRQRITQAIVAQRQRLMDMPAIAPPALTEGIPSASQSTLATPAADDPSPTVLPSTGQPTDQKQGTSAADAPAIPLIDTPPALNEASTTELSTVGDQQIDTGPAVDAALSDSGADANVDAVVAAPESMAGEPIALAPIDSGRAVPSGDPPNLAQAPLYSRGTALLRAARESGKTDAPLPSHTPHRGAGAAPPSSTVVGPPAEGAPPWPAEPLPMVEPDNGWPIGPAPLGHVAMAELMIRLVATPAIVAGQPNELGVTKNRLVDLLKGTQKAQARELAEILMVWLDLAGLLMEPTKPGRLRHPRPLSTTNLAEIAARLNATPCPDRGIVKAMWSESNEGRN